MIAIVVDIGGTSIKGSAINDKGEVLDRFSLGVNKNDLPEKTIGDLCNLLKEFINSHQYDEPISGIGIGSHGVIDWQQYLTINRAN